MRTLVASLVVLIGCPVETQYIGGSAESSDDGAATGDSPDPECSVGPCVRWYHELEHPVLSRLFLDPSGRIAFVTHGENAQGNYRLDAFDVVSATESLTSTALPQSVLLDYAFDASAGACALTPSGEGQSIQRLALDGSVQWTTAFELPIVLERVDVAADGACAGEGRTSVGEQSVGYIARIAPTGTLDWEWQTPPQDPSLTTDVTLRGFVDEAIVVDVFMGAEAAPGTGTHRLVQLLDGDVAASIDVGAVLPGLQMNVIDRVDGGWLLIGEVPQGGVQLAVVDDAGTLRWNRIDDSTEQMPVVARATASAVLVVTRSSDGAGETAYIDLRTYDLDGNLGAVEPLPGTGARAVYGALALPDGTVALLGSTVVDAVPSSDWLVGVLP